ncbi:MAG: hypothetical protein BWX72_01541 [Firmicutes bacterium ADurb.Bin080]|jgi:hypothetical protein|nr:hypothetical protein [Clostridiales bacterium]OQC13781.1 MAG: hypothetical protein BWX72_01541 [Firmicutes bacterium ADurb.Bin080]
MKKKTIIAVLCIALCFAVIMTATACTENYKVDGVETDLSNIDTTSNNGLAVRVGKYLYFINGYADKTGDNDFGDTVKGAIMRVELENQKPKMDTLVTVVPKNVYNSSPSIGITVVGEYIYYTTPSIEKDSKGEPMTSKMDLMRTKLDGTGTQKIASFDDYSVSFRVTPTGYILYVREYNLHEIDLSTKRFKDREIATEIGDVKFLPYGEGVNSLSDTIIYTKNDDSTVNYFNHVYSFKAGAEEPKEVFNGLSSYEGKTLEHSKGYRISLTEIIPIGADSIRLFYSKTDSGVNTRSKGNYSYDFDFTFSFEWENEVRYTEGVNYTDFDILGEGYIFALDSDSYDLGIRGIDGTWTFAPAVSGSSLKILGYKETGNEVHVQYIVSNKLYTIKALDKAGSDYVISLEGAYALYKAGYFSTWLGYDKVYDTIYFFNSDVKNYTYYLDLSAVDRNDERTMKATRIGLFSHADEIDMLVDPPTAEE